MTTFKRSPLSLQLNKNRIFAAQQQQQTVENTKLVSTPPPKAQLKIATNQRFRKVSRLRHLAKFSPVRHWFFDNVRNYCRSTSLHGFNYITLKGSTPNERFFWILIVIISIIISVVLVVVSWFWNSETPTVTVIESAHYPTWNIPFPAVTICNFNKISKTKALNMAKKLKRPENVTEEKLLKLFRLTMFLNFAIKRPEEEISVLSNILTNNNMTLVNLATDLTPDCIEMISKCTWKGSSSRCDSLFQPIQTMEGVCCSFNYYARPLNNFPKKIAYQISKRPYRVTGCGYATGISVTLNPITNDYYGTYLSSYGFRVLVHDAYNYPEENAETKVVTSGRESFVRINPESTYAAANIRKMAIKDRKCLFYNERKLVSLQRYSFINCMSTCRAMILYKSCGCIPMSLPNNGSYKICDLKEIYCVVNMREIFALALPVLNETLSNVQKTYEFPCNCLPDCEFNSYPSEITMGMLDTRLVSSKTSIDKSVSVSEQSLLHVFFSDLMAKRYRMDIFQNWLSSLASFGGLLGLIMGFSIVTAFEFLYFLTFRPIFNYFNDT